MSNIFPIPRPPTPPSWCGHPGHPDWCDCGCGPPCPPSTVDAWREMARFKDMLRSIIDEMGITAKPLPGVIDGSDVKPGQVGELLHFYSSGLAFDAASKTQTVSLGVVPPGDWQLQSQFAVQTGSVGSLSCFLSPLPAGVTHAMQMYYQIDVAAIPAVGEISTPSLWARANVTVPTLLVYSLVTNFFQNGTAGTCSLALEGRRMR